MRNLQRAVVMMGVVAGSTCAASIFVGCSGDDTTMTDGGPDTSTDQNMPDVVPDVPTKDGGSDVVDSGADGGNQYDNFRKALAQAFCTRFQNCCNGLDAGPFDYNLCYAGTLKQGVEGSNFDLQVPEIINGQNITLDQTAAQTCLAGLATLSCPIVTSNEWKMVSDACMAAVVGKLPVNSKCLKPIECQPGEYCNYAVDAGQSEGGVPYGVCANLLGQGVKCGQSSYYYKVNNLYSSEECGYKNWPKPRFCNYDTDPNQNGFFCDNPRTNGTVCYTNNECASELCVDVADAGTCGTGKCQCQTTQDYSNFCKIAKIKDAGPG